MLRRRANANQSPLRECGRWRGGRLSLQTGHSRRCGRKMHRLLQVGMLQLATDAASCKPYARAIAARSRGIGTNKLAAGDRIHRRRQRFSAARSPLMHYNCHIFIAVVLLPDGVLAPSRLSHSVWQKTVAMGGVCRYVGKVDRTETSCAGGMAFTLPNRCD